LLWKRRILTRLGVSTCLLIDDCSWSLSVNLPMELVVESVSLTALLVCLAVEADNSNWPGDRLVNWAAHCWWKESWSGRIAYWLCCNSPRGWWPTWPPWEDMRFESFTFFINWFYLKFLEEGRDPPALSLRRSSFDCSTKLLCLTSYFWGIIISLTLLGSTPLCSSITVRFINLGCSRFFLFWMCMLLIALEEAMVPTECTEVLAWLDRSYAWAAAIVLLELGATDPTELTRCWLLTAALLLARAVSLWELLSSWFY